MPATASEGDPSSPDEAMRTIEDAARNGTTIAVPTHFQGSVFSDFVGLAAAVATTWGVSLAIETAGLPHDIDRFQRLLNAGWQEDPSREGRGRRFTFPHEDSGDDFTPPSS